MGALKHAILPLMALFHATLMYGCMDLGRWAESVLLEVEQASDCESKRQLHMIGSMRGFNVAFFFLCMAGIVTESAAHFRGIVAFADAFFLAVCASDAVQLGLHFELPATISAVILVGVLIHSREPGVFTKDKNREKSG
jgi:hypothetical protein